MILPLSLSDGSPFPARELAILLAAGVIVVSLLAATIGLPSILRGLSAPASARHQRTHRRGRGGDPRDPVGATTARGGIAGRRSSRGRGGAAGRALTGPDHTSVGRRRCVARATRTPASNTSHRRRVARGAQRDREDPATPRHRRVARAGDRARARSAGGAATRPGVGIALIAAANAALNRLTPLRRCTSRAAASAPCGSRPGCRGSSARSCRPSARSRT